MPIHALQKDNSFLFICILPAQSPCNVVDKYISSLIRDIMALLAWLYVSLWMVSGAVRNAEETVVSYLRQRQHSAMITAWSNQPVWNKNMAYTS